MGRHCTLRIQQKNLLFLRINEGRQIISHMWGCYTKYLTLVLSSSEKVRLVLFTVIRSHTKHCRVHCKINVLKCFNNLETQYTLFFVSSYYYNTTDVTLLDRIQVDIVSYGHMCRSSLSKCAVRVTTSTSKTRSCKNASKLKIKYHFIVHKAPMMFQVFKAHE